MNADRLHALLIKIQEDLERTELPTKLQDLSTALANQVNSPHPSHSEAIGVSFKEVIAATEMSLIDDLSPAWKAMIEEVGYTDYLGAAVARKLSESFKQADVTPTLVQEDVDTLSSKLTELQEAVDQALPAFEVLSIGTEGLDAGECELGFMIPPLAIDRRLDSFADECKDFDFIFRTFSEVVTGARDHYQINTISSSDLSVFLESTPAVALAISAATERIITIYKKLLEIKKLRAEMINQDVPKEALSEIDDHANSQMSSEIGKITQDIMKNHGKSNDSGRRNELRNALTISLQNLRIG